MKGTTTNKTRSRIKSTVLKGSLFFSTVSTAAHCFLLKQATLVLHREAPQ